MKVFGLDVGTMNIVSATRENTNNEDVIIKTIRNMFVEVDTDLISLAEIKNTDLDILQLENRVFIISEDCLKFSQIFGQDPKRPMSNGVISKGEIDSAIILKLMLESIMGRSDDERGYCVYSIPGEPVDNNTIKILYHEKIFSKILNEMGYNTKALNEGMGVVFSNCEDSRFTGIGISWGCGMTNVAVSYRGIPSLQFSVARGGDFIDQNVSDSLGVPVSRITGLKERKLTLNDELIQTKNVREKQVFDALRFYYQDLINYVLRYLVAAFKNNTSNLDIDESIPIIISGGTSLPFGFCDLVKKVLEKTEDFPYDISEIRQAADPLNAVAIGNFKYAEWDSKRLEK
jgi:actin-like ATPase involved in cell morphogenesis